MEELGGEQARSLLAVMWRIRLFEERVGQLARAGEIDGLIHLSTGQEGVAAAVCTQLRDDDHVYSGHRAHGHAIAKGAGLGPVMAELMGRDTGLCRGLGGRLGLRSHDPAADEPGDEEEEARPHGATPFIHLPATSRRHST